MSSSDTDDDLSGSYYSDTSYKHVGNSSCIPDMSKLKPYDHEPRIPSSEVSSASSSNTDEPEELERLGTTNCGNCFAMETNTESLCSHERSTRCAF